MKSFLNYSKNRFLYGLIKFGFLLLALYTGYSLFGCIQVYALTNVTSSKNLYYYSSTVSGESQFEVNYDDYLTKFTNGIEVGQGSTYPTAAMFWFNGINYEKGDTVYLKVNFTFYNSGTCVKSDYLSSFNRIVSIMRVEGSATDWSTEYLASNIVSTLSSLSETDQQVTVTFNITPTSAGNGFRISWGNNADPSVFGFNTCDRAVYFGISSAEYEVVGSTDSVIIDQNQTIIDQNQQTNDKLDDLKDSIGDAKDEINDTIKDSFEQCRDSNNLLNINSINNKGDSFTKNGITFTFNNDGTVTANGTATGQIELLLGTVTLEPGSYKASIDVNGSTATYYVRLGEGTTSSSPFIANVGGGDNEFVLSQSKTVGALLIVRNGVTLNNVVFKPMIRLSSVSNATFEPYGKVCQNRLDETNDQLGNLNDNITDSTPPNLDGLADSAGWLPAGPVDSILNLPISLLNNLNDNLGGTCQPANLTLPFINQNITLPCMSDVYKKIGISGWVNTVGTIAAAFIAYYYLLELYKWVDNVLTMRENQWNDVDQWGGI